jgi:pimeloyl-ACP methyl ester carboxylesterase
MKLYANHQDKLMTKYLKPLTYTFLLVIVMFIVYVIANKVPDKSVEELKPRWAQSPSKFVDVNGLNIHYRDEGLHSNLPPIVLLHGTSASLHTWDGWVEALKKQHRVIRFDMPAFGLTGPDVNNDYSIENYSQTVINVMDKLGVERFILGGNSLGGYVAWATAVLHPNHVEKLILVDPSGYPLESTSVPIAFRLAQMPILNQILEGFMPRSLIQKSVENVYGDPALVTDDLVDRYLELNTRTGNRHALIERFRQTRPGTLSKRLPEVTVPTLIIWGAQDGLIPVSAAQKFQKDIAHAELVIFEDLGHVPHEEAPQITVKAVQTFLLQ